MPIFQNPTVRPITVFQNGLGPDGITWPQAWPHLIDPFGKFLVGLGDTSDAVHLAYSNDGGMTWLDGLAQPYITRGAMALDTRHDILHVLWRCGSPSDGILYRRYQIARDGQGNITAITRDNAINLQLDFNASDYEHPILFWLDDAQYGSYGALLAIWHAQTASGVEVRSSLRVLSGTSDDNLPGNWQAPISPSTSQIGNPPSVPYTALMADTAAGFLPPYPAAVITSSGDLWLFYTQRVGGAPSYRFRKAARSGAGWGTLTAPTSICPIARQGTDGGYSLKYQLFSHPSEHKATGRVAIGFATWKNGDTWSFVEIDPSGSLGPIVDVYTANPANCGPNIFVTGDIAYDQASGLILASYTDLPAKSVWLVPYKNGQAQDPPLSLFTARPFDIPTIYQDWRTGSARCREGTKDRVIILGRDYNPEAANNPPSYTPPYSGYLLVADIITGGPPCLLLLGAGL